MANEIFTPAQIAQVISGISTPIIAAIVAFIAYKQWLTNRAVLREKLFDRRFAIFRETQGYLSEILRDAKISDASMRQFTDTCQRAKFLFGDEFHAYLFEIRNRSIEMNMHQRIAKDLPIGEDRSSHIHKEHEELKWLIDQLDVIFEKFDPFLSFSKER